MSVISWRTWLNYGNNKISTESAVISWWRWVFCCRSTSLPGCISQGKTREEALVDIEEAISLYIEVLQDRNEPVPEDTVLMGY